MQSIKKKTHPTLIRVSPDLFLPAEVQTVGDLLRMQLVQIGEQHVLVLFLALVPGHVVAPAADGRCQAAWHIRFLCDFRNRVEVGANCEDDAA